MKKPKQPHRPQKPVAPQKRIKQAHRIEFADLLPRNVTRYASKSESLSAVLAKIPAGISLDDISLCEESNFDYYSGEGGPTHYLQYYTEIDNPHYDRQMEWHITAQRAYDKKIVKYAPLQEVYLKEQAVYEEWYKVHIRQRQLDIKNAEIAKLKKELAKLEKSREIQCK